MDVVAFALTDWQPANYLHRACMALFGAITNSIVAHQAVGLVSDAGSTVAGAQMTDSHVCLTLTLDFPMAFVSTWNVIRFSMSSVTARLPA